MTEEGDLEKRVAALEGTLQQILDDCTLLRRGQEEAKSQLEQTAEEQKEGLRKEGEAVRAELMAQSTALLKVSQSMMNLQSAVQKWAAAGTLCGAVVLYIIAKVAGL